jgi:Na+/H+ antiporter NhaD/arsenite permease-like protein
MPGRLAVAFIIAVLSVVASAATADAAELDGATMGAAWALPFVAVLLTIATGPLVFPKLWHDHYGKIAAFWALVALVAIALGFGLKTALAAFVHATLGEYLSFIVLLFALYTVAGGILVTGNVHGTPKANTAMLALGTLMASVVGTTGASMILIRPLLRANDERPRSVHVVVFFIFLVANIGGALTPLGDPPLFVGFLRGVDFFWPARHLAAEAISTAAILLVAFFLLDSWIARREGAYVRRRDPTPPEPIRVRGLVNLVLIAAIVGAIVLSATWKPGISLDLLGTRLELQNLVRDGFLMACALLSLWWTHDEHRAANGFTWEPILEVAKLFAAIFVTIIPVLAMLQAGEKGVFAPLLDIVTRHDGTPHPVAFFWVTGILSAFLDNAPTYLVFFELAGGNAAELMGKMAATLGAISMGAVFMGALTYIGNAPNLMVYALAVERGVKMPSFFGYLGWAIVWLVPVFLVLTFISIVPA